MYKIQLGRVGLTYFSYCFMSVALTIAIRYAAIRKQFGASPGNELPIIEYQLHVRNRFNLHFYYGLKIDILNNLLYLHILISLRKISNEFFKT